MRHLTVREMRQGYQVLVKNLEEEGEVLLTHHGKPFARVLPLVSASSATRLAERAKQLAAFRATLPQQQLRAEDAVRQDRNGH